MGFNESLHFRRGRVGRRTSGQRGARYARRPAAAMAASATRYVERIVARECAAAVVALKAVVSGCRQMLAYRDHCNLLRIGNAAAHRVALAAADAAMVAVPKDSPERILRLCSPVIWPKLVARTARADLFVGRVAPVTVGMGIYSYRYRLSRTRGIVACGTALCRAALAAVVSRVVELHIESLDKICRERLDRRFARLGVRVANRTHRLVLAARELIEMTADA